MMLRKATSLACIALALSVGTVTSATASSPSAAGIFSALQGTTTIDQGGVIHSQARTMVSLGGGSISSEGRRVSLLAVDAPGFSAGCNGISWHFGGFSFISMDEIRQLVEAVAQASLGVAVDLAMQTLCPQCYAVMSKLREISNAMRNAAADACSIAKNMKYMIQKSGLLGANSAMTNCAEVKADAAKNDSWLGGIASGACSLMNSAQSAMDEYGGTIGKFLNGDMSAGEKTPTKEQLQDSGNITYRALSALGVSDGFSKDLMMSILGMSVMTPSSDTDCTKAFANIRSSDSMETKPAVSKRDPVSSATDSKEVASAADSRTNAANVEAGQSTKAPGVCHFPPLFNDFGKVSNVLICGVDPQRDAELFFARNFPLMTKSQWGNMSLYAMCGDGGSDSKLTKSMYMYTCAGTTVAGNNGKKHTDCLEPGYKSLTEYLAENTKYTGHDDDDITGKGYTGMAWMLADTLFSTAVQIRKEPTKELPPETIAIINGANYPLYRILNMAAVYEHMAGELLQAYSARIALHHVMDTMDKVVAIGSNPAFKLDGQMLQQSQEVLLAYREHLAQRPNQVGSRVSKVLERFNDKRAMVQSILEVNRAIQSEVLSMGLSANNTWALSLRKMAAAGGAGN